MQCLQGDWRPTILYSADSWKLYDKLSKVIRVHGKLIRATDADTDTDRAPERKYKERAGDSDTGRTRKRKSERARYR